MRGPYFTRSRALRILGTHRYGLVVRVTLRTLRNAGGSCKNAARSLVIGGVSHMLSIHPPTPTTEEKDRETRKYTRA